MPDNDRDGTEPESLWVATGRYMGHGLTWALSTLLFLLLGGWVDSKVGTMPLFMILGAFVGGAAGFYSLYHHLVQDSRNRNSENDA